jgi:carnitine-CoA ligase
VSIEVPLPIKIEQQANSNPDKIFVQEVNGVDHTYEQFHAACRRWSDAFAAAGVKPGEYVASMLPIGMTSYCCWIGLSWLGAAEVPINTQFVSQTLLYPLQNCQVRVLVIDEQFVGRLASLVDALSYFETVVVVGSVEGALRLPWRVISVDEFLAGGTPAPYVIPRYHDPHAVIYTSGTTGPSKGVLQPWVNIQDQAHGTFPGQQLGDYEDGAIYTCWPTFHSSGKFGMTIASEFDLRMVLRPGFSLSNFWSDIRTHRCTHATLLVVAGLILSQPELPDDLENPLEKVGMYPLFPGYRAFEKRFGVTVTAGYGGTETGSVASTSDPLSHRVNGKPREGYIVRIVNDDGEPLPVGQVGEIVIRHEHPWRLNSGYVGRPELTAQSWRDGWFRTGDAGQFDDQGNLYFVDRLNDYLRHRGHNVSSFEVEAEVLAHDGVEFCACIGVPSDLAVPGQTVPDDDIKVFVVRKAGSPLTAAGLYAFLEPQVPVFMLPRYVEFVDELPRTPTGKVRKVDLRERPRDPATEWEAPRRGRKAASGVRHLG